MKLFLALVLIGLASAASRCTQQATSIYGYHDGKEDKNSLPYNIRQDITWYQNGNEVVDTFDNVGKSSGNFCFTYGTASYPDDVGDQTYLASIRSQAVAAGDTCIFGCQNTSAPLDCNACNGGPCPDMLLSPNGGTFFTSGTCSHDGNINSKEECFYDCAPHEPVSYEANGIDMILAEKPHSTGSRNWWKAGADGSVWYKKNNINSSAMDLGHAAYVLPQKRDATNVEEKRALSTVSMKVVASQQLAPAFHNGGNDAMASVCFFDNGQRLLAVDTDDFLDGWAQSGRHGQGFSSLGQARASGTYYVYSMNMQAHDDFQGTYSQALNDKMLYLCKFTVVNYSVTSDTCQSTLPVALNSLNATYTNRYGGCLFITFPPPTK